MAEDELKVALESLRGEVKRLNTVLKMSMAEQRRINADLTAIIQRQAESLEDNESRLDKLQTRLAAYTGGLMALWFFFQIAQKFLR
ncbi:MAG: hypothetical protein PVG03_01805 [Desulfarculaceae bacterium]